MVVKERALREQAERLAQDCDQRRTAAVAEALTQLRTEMDAQRRKELEQECRPRRAEKGTGSSSERDAREQTSSSSRFFSSVELLSLQSSGFLNPFPVFSCTKI